MRQVRRTERIFLQIEPGWAWDSHHRSSRRVVLQSSRCRMRGSWTGCSSKQPLRAQILINFGPVNAIAATGNTPIGPLIDGSMQEALIKAGSQPSKGFRQ